MNSAATNVVDVMDSADDAPTHRLETLDNHLGDVLRQVRPAALAKAGARAAARIRRAPLTALVVAAALGALFARLVGRTARPVGHRLG